MINEKFFSLPEEKRLAIINAGYRVFSQNSYKKSPMSEIAAEARISKSLLFHYFRNKKELYLFLLENAATTTLHHLHDFQCYESEDMFEIMFRGLKAKICMMKKYPDLTSFIIKGYYETCPDVCGEIQKIIGKYAAFQNNSDKLKINPDQFLPGIDLKMMYNDMYMASEGFLWEKLQNGRLDIDEIEQEFAAMISFWKSIYLRKGEENEHN